MVILPNTLLVPAVRGGGGGGGGEAIQYIKDQMLNVISCKSEKKE